VARPSKAAGGTTPQRGRWLREVWASSIGKKVIVAISGVILAGFIVGHVLGNLKALEGNGEGRPPIDHYADWLRDIGDPALPHSGALWILRTILISALVLHVTGVLQLWQRNQAARPAGNPAPRIRRSLSSRTMMWTGLLIFAFLVFHILQFTTGTVHPTRYVEGEVYGNLYDAFQDWWLVAIYVAVAIFLGYHLRHALWSLVQTLGWDKPNRNPTFRRAASVTAIVVAVGFAAVPVAFFAGALPEPGSNVDARQAPPAGQEAAR
jgi:succinate dehydrogenase cytochrome b subunit